MEKEKAQLMFKLAYSKKNWGAKYDRLEHFKRFQHRDEIIKELSNLGWIIIHKKGKFTGISLNTNYKKEIVKFIETQMPHVKGVIR